MIYTRGEKGSWETEKEESKKIKKKELLRQVQAGQSSEWGLVEPCRDLVELDFHPWLANPCRN